MEIIHLLLAGILAVFALIYFTALAIQRKH